MAIQAYRQFAQGSPHELVRNEKHQQTNILLEMLFHDCRPFLEE